MEASFAKLRDGSWGVRVKGGIPRPGEVVRVSKRDGSGDQAKIDKVLWQGDDVAICSIVPKAESKPAVSSSFRAREGGSRTRSGRCVDCGGPLGTLRGCSGDKRRCYDCDS
jgi:hypothetical protein